MGVMKKTKYKRRVKQKKKWYIPLAVCGMLLIMGVQIFRLYQKDYNYKLREEALEEQIRNEEQRALDLEEYEMYTQSEEFIRNTARTKLGLVNDNEIIFKEK